MIPGLYPMFNHWHQNSAVWIYSDPHFSDPEMVHLRKNYIGDDEQIARINSKVGRKDTIIFLGDIGDEEKVRKIRGYKVLIMGNHDKGATKYEELFDEVYSGPLFIGEKLLLSHEPIALPFAYNIHGHDHSNWDAGMKHHMNVCAEHIEYTPVNLTRLLKRGLLSKVETIHRATIDGATSRKKAREAKYGKRT
jgi:calcineurin-like phosphoesterase family protein